MVNPSQPRSETRLASVLKADPTTCTPHGENGLHSAARQLVRGWFADVTPVMVNALAGPSSNKLGEQIGWMFKR